MIDLISYAVSIALYVLQALGLYAIAQRRGIARAWLAWVPIGNLWLLASIADDFKQKTRGKKRKLRYWLPSLAAVKASKRLALANKESLVVAGEHIMREAAEREGVGIVTTPMSQFAASVALSSLKPSSK